MNRRLPEHVKVNIKYIYSVYLDAFSLSRIPPATPVWWRASGRVWLCISSLPVKKWKLKIDRAHTTNALPNPNGD